MMIKYCSINSPNLSLTILDWMSERSHVSGAEQVLNSRVPDIIGPILASLKKKYEAWEMLCW